MLAYLPPSKLNIASMYDIIYIYAYIMCIYTKSQFRCDIVFQSTFWTQIIVDTMHCTDRNLRATNYCKNNRHIIIIKYNVSQNVVAFMSLLRL